MAHPHTCLTCGFLTRPGQEFLAKEREALVAEQAAAEAVRLGCYLELWDEGRLERSLPNLLQEVQTARTCVGYLAHEPGQSPKQHLVKSVQRQRRRPRWHVPALVGLLLVIGIGAVLARGCGA